MKLTIDTKTRYPKEEMTEAFNRVCNKENWKNPIDTTIRATEKDLDVIHDAIVFFTGSMADIWKVRKGMYRVQAAGYYLTIGA